MSTTDVFFYSYYLNDDLLKQRHTSPKNPRAARIHHWQLSLKNDSTLVRKLGGFADGVVYSLTEAELATLYGCDDIASYQRQTVTVELLSNGQSIEVFCYIAPESAENSLPENPEYVRLLLEAMYLYGLNTQYVEQVYATIKKVAVLHIPHSSVLVPAHWRDSILLSDNELQLEQLRMTDWFTDELFDVGSSFVSSVRFPISRLLLDPERFEDDALEPMFAKGMGVIYTRTSHNEVLRNPPSVEERQALIDGFYQPHHQQLTNAVQSMLNHRGQALVIDCHSFPSQPLPYEVDNNPSRADICIGTDEFHTSSGLCDLAVSLFERQGFVVAVNQPFAGALVPSEFYRANSKVAAIMIEVNRGLYMHEGSGAKTENFGLVKEKIQQVINKLLESRF